MLDCLKSSYENVPSEYQDIGPYSESSFIDKSASKSGI